MSRILNVRRPWYFMVALAAVLFTVGAISSNYIWLLLAYIPALAAAFWVGGR